MLLTSPALRWALLPDDAVLDGAHAVEFCHRSDGDRAP